MLEQCCNRSKQCRNNVATLCCAKGRCWESSRVTLSSNVQYLQTLRFCFRRGDERNRRLESYSDPDKYLSFSIGGKEKWYLFFLVCENFVREHFCFFFADCVESVKFFKSVED